LLGKALRVGHNGAPEEAGAIRIGGLPLARGKGRPVYRLQRAYRRNGPPLLSQPRLDGQALFINQKGDRAWGTVESDRVWIPAWREGFGRQGLSGQIQGNRIM
jgi:hypothetical protein